MFNAPYCCRSSMKNCLVLTKLIYFCVNKGEYLLLDHVRGKNNVISSIYEEVDNRRLN